MSNIILLTGVCEISHGLIPLFCVCILGVLISLFLKKALLRHYAVAQKIKDLSRTSACMQILKEKVVEQSGNFEKELQSKSLETQLLMSQAKEREQFMTIMGHQIRTSLNLILGYSQILSDSTIQLSPDDVRRYGEEMSYDSDRLMKIIEDVLTMTLIDNSNVKVSLENISLKNHVETAVATIGVTLKKEGCRVKIPDNQPNVEVRADALFLSRIIENILDNACRFSPQDSTITVWWTDNGDNTVSLYIKDEGCGISPEYHEKIFQRFFKVNTFSPGVGLGLFLARKQSEKFGASVSVDSALGEGSTFVVKLLKVEKE